MRPHGRAHIDVNSPRARAVCDRCGLMYNHYQLRWQHDWRGPKLQNLRFLVCKTCYDTYQQNGQRTIVLPPDPLPIMNARPEYYVQDDNPMSTVGGSNNPLINYAYAGQAGTTAAIQVTFFGGMVNGGGILAAFNSAKNKPAAQCAQNVISNSSYELNDVGIRWDAARGITTFASPTPLNGNLYFARTLTKVVITAPNDQSFLRTTPTTYVIQGQNLNAAPGLSINSSFPTWTTLATGSTAGTKGEVITTTQLSGGAYEFHRVAFLGDGINPVVVAQVEMSIAEGGAN